MDSKRTRVFLSYSRKDLDFVVWLGETLTQRGYDSVYDLASRPTEDPNLQLTAQDEWWLTLTGMIAACDVMVFAVSPDSANSSVCDDEIAHAKALGKRIVAVVRRRIDLRRAPERLRALNIKIDMSAQYDALGPAVDALCTEVDVDIDWHRRNTDLTRLANRWHADGRPTSQLLRAGAVMDADKWARRRPNSAEAPGEIVLAFVDESRAHERAEAEAKERTRTQLRRTAGRAYVKPTIQAIADLRHDHALRLAAAGMLLADDPEFALVPELWRACARAVVENHLQSILVGHSYQVLCVSWSPDGSCVATGASDGTVRIWDPKTGEQLHCLTGHQSYVSSVAWTPRGDRVASASADKTSRVWDVRSGQLVRLLDDHLGAVAKAIWSPKGNLLLTVSSDYGDRVLRVWDVEDGKAVLWLSGHDGQVHDAAWSSDGRWIATASADKTVGVWDAGSGEGKAWSGFDTGISHVAWSPQGGRLVAVAEMTLHIMTLDGSSREVKAVSEGIWINHVSWAPDGVRLATAADDRIVRVWHALTGAEVARLEGHTSEVHMVAWSPDGTRLATASDDCTARLWDSVTGAEVGRRIGHDRRVSSVAWSPDGRRLATASFDRSARVWDVRGSVDDQARLSGIQASADELAWSPDGMRIVLGAVDGGLVEWEVRSGAVRSRAHGRRVLRSVGWSQRGTWFAAGWHGGQLDVWDAAWAPVALPERATSLPAAQSSNAVVCAAWAPIGDRLGVVWSSGTVELIDMEKRTRRDFTRVNGPERLAWSHDGERLAIMWGGNRGSVTVYQVSTALIEFEARYRDECAWCPASSRLAYVDDGAICIRNARDWSDAQHVAHVQDDVVSLAWSPDGRRLATGGRDTVVVWELGSDRPPVWLRGQRGAIRSILWSPDGLRLLTSSIHLDDRSVRVWDTRSGAELFRIDEHEEYVRGMAWSPDGTRVVITVDDFTARVIDVQHTARASRPAECIMASLMAGLGTKTIDERSDLLLEELPEDLYEALRARLRRDAGPPSEADAKPR